MTDKEKQTAARLRAASEVYVIFSGATNCPYVVCDRDTADDEILLYLKRPDGRKERDRLTEEGIPVSLAIVKNKQFLYFYTSLYTMGVNAVMVYDGNKPVRIQLTDLVKHNTSDAETDGKVWIENPELHLTAIYLMQEIRKAPQAEPTQEEKDMLDEIKADLANAHLIQPVVKDQKAVPMLQLKDEKYQPLFTDILEFQKFNTDDQFNPLIVDADKLKCIILPQADGILINPRGVNLPLKISRTLNTAQKSQTGQGS